MSEDTREALERAVRDYLDAKDALDKRENLWPDGTTYEEVKAEYHEAEHRLREALRARQQGEGGEGLDRETLAALRVVRNMAACSGIMSVEPDDPYSRAVQMVTDNFGLAEDGRVPNETEALSGADVSREGREGDGLGSCRICGRPTDGVTICTYCDRMMQSALEMDRPTPEPDGDALTVARWVVGWWLGLEGDIRWGTAEENGEHKAYRAAKRLMRRADTEEGESRE